MLYVPVTCGGAESQWLIEVSATNSCWKEAGVYQFLIFGRDLSKDIAKATVQSWLVKHCNVRHWCVSAAVKLGAEPTSTVAYGPEVTILRAI